jgi:multiple sugar transport system ATP-binding protein
MAEIRLENVHKRFAEFTAVEDSSFTIENGEFFVLLGPSGCGKTTTLRMIAGLELPTSGSILLGGEDVTFKRAAHRDIAFVFQLFALYPHMNVRQNLSFPLRMQGTPRGEIKTRVVEVAKLLRIEHLLNKPVGGLAGGDRQRVALGRAIIRRPAAFLMDEPLGTLDAEFRDLMCRELRHLHERIGATTVYVTHDQVEAMAMADRIAVMEKGRVLQIGSPLEVYARPANLFVASFIGSPAMNLLKAGGQLPRGAATLRLGEASLPIPPLAEGVAGEVVLGVRPEHVTVGDGPLKGEVAVVEYMGARQILTVDTPAGRLKVRAPHALSLRQGERIGLAFDPDRVVIFDADSGEALRFATRPVLREAAHG